MRRIAGTIQESIWFPLAVTWAAAAFVAWLLALTQGTFRGALSDSGVVVAAILIAQVTVALRLPTYFGHKEPTRQPTASILWWLCWWSLINWLGFLALSTRSFADFCLAGVLLLATEVCFHFQIVRLGRHPWQEHCKYFTDFNASIQTNVTHADHPNPASDHQAGDNVEDADEAARLSRKSVEGTDRDSRRYLSGWVKFQFAQKQKTDSLSIAFCPAIVGEIDIELECQPETVSAKSTTVTPAGMRVELRRTEASEMLAGILYWQATELSDRSHSERDLPRSIALP